MARFLEVPLALTLFVLSRATAPGAPLAVGAPPGTPVQEFVAAAIAPDAHSLAWVTGSGEDSRTLYQATLPGAGGTQKVSPPGGPCSNSDPVWSPDSSTLAFLSTCGAPATNPAQQQIFLYAIATRKMIQLTHLTGNPQELAFSPDGRTLAFLFVPNATRSAGALDAMKPWSGVIGEEGIEVQRVAAVDLGTSALTEITPETLHAFEFTWSPDSHSIAFVGAKAPGENNWWVSQLYTERATAGAVPRSILDAVTVAGPLHGLQIAVPRWSPDGREIAFIGGLMSDQGATGGDLYTVPATGGPPINLTPGRTATPTWISYVAPHTLLVSEDAQAATHIFRFNTETRAEETGDTASELRQAAHLSAAASPVRSPSPPTARLPSSAPPSRTRRRSSPAHPPTFARSPGPTTRSAAPAHASSPSPGQTITSTSRAGSRTPPTLTLPSAIR